MGFWWNFLVGNGYMGFGGLFQALTHTRSHQNQDKILWGKQSSLCNEIVKVSEEDSNKNGNMEIYVDDFEELEVGCDVPKDAEIIKVCY